MLLDWSKPAQKQYFLYILFSVHWIMIMTFFFQMDLVAVMSCQCLWASFGGLRVQQWGFVYVHEKNIYA